MGAPIVHGPGYSTYVRSTRMTLEEKGVAYDLQEFDFMQGMPEEHLARHPFGKVPAFEHASAFGGWGPTLTGAGDAERLRGGRFSHGMSSFETNCSTHFQN